MSGKLQKNMSSFLVTGLIALLVISFMFADMGSMQGGGGGGTKVASVGNIPVTATEYNREYERQIRFFGQMLGKKSLTSQEIKQFNIKDAALKTLVRQKLNIKMANDFGIEPSQAEVGEEIKKLPYFQTNEKFDINLYKNLLSQNRMTPANFETDMSNQLKTQQVNTLFQAFPLSQGYYDSIRKFKLQRLSAEVVQINKEDMRKHIPVSRQEVTTYLSEDINKKRVKNLFEEREASLSKPLEVLASHILISTKDNKDADALKKANSIASKLSVSNFVQQANKHTDDPSGKGKGGSLSWFKKGDMVPDFEKTAFSMKVGEISKPVKTQFGYHIIHVRNRRDPVKAVFANYEKDLARELIRKSKTKELDELVANIGKDVKSAMDAGNKSKIIQLEKRYGFSHSEKSGINRYTGLVGTLNLPRENVNSIFKDESNINKLYSFDNSDKLTILKTSPFSMKKQETPAVLKQDKTSMEKALAGKFRQGLMEDLEKNIKVKTLVQL